MRNFAITMNLLLAGLAADSAAFAQVYDSRISAVEGGGAIQTSGGDYTLSATVGQPIVSEMSGGPFEMRTGFWAGIENGRPGGCNGGEVIQKAKCKTKKGAVRKVLVVVKKATPQVTYSAMLDTGETLNRDAKSNGKLKFVFKGSNAPPCNSNGVTVCGLHRAFDCGC